MRPAQDKDKPFLAMLHESVRQDLLLIDAEEEYIKQIVEMQLRAQTEGYGQQFPNAMYFVIEKHHELIGKVTVDFGHNEVRLVEIAFLPQARGLGFGEVIIRSLMVAAEQSKVPMTLTVARNNPGAFKLYCKLGFVVEQEDDMYILMTWKPMLNAGQSIVI